MGVDWGFQATRKRIIRATATATATAVAGSNRIKQANFSPRGNVKDREASAAAEINLRIGSVDGGSTVTLKYQTKCSLLSTRQLADVGGRSLFQRSFLDN